MTRRSLVFALQAEDDINGIFDFIAAENPRRALSYTEEIRQSCRGLCQAPMMGVDRSDLQPGVRVWSLRRRIVVVYELAPDAVRILRVFSAGRDYEAIIGGDGP